MTANYVGWLKTNGGAWREVCRASTEPQCWRELLAVPRVGHTDSMVLREGEHPLDRQRFQRVTGRYQTRQMTPDSP